LWIDRYAAWMFLAAPPGGSISIKKHRSFRGRVAADF
jgi:hypothetical protein